MKNLKGKLHKQLTCKLSIAMICLMFSGCEKFIAVELPSSQLIGTSVFKDASTANAALAQLYIMLRDEVMVSGNVNGISVTLGYYSDELVHYGSDNNLYYQNNLNPTDFMNSSYWNKSYNLIYATNALLEGVEASTVLSGQDKTQLTGEGLFIRALMHFYLVNLYGAVPYLTNTNYQLNKRIVKSSPDAVYAAVLADLTKARSLLQDEYITVDRARPNRAVVDALLARIYLYTENWEQAEQAATAIINRTGLYTWVDDLDKVFLNNSTGTLWQMASRVSGENTMDARNFIFTSGPPPFRALSAVLVNAFEEDDLRKRHWLGSVSKGADTWYFAYKYKQNNPTDISRECKILFRLEELYLIRAEARAMTGKLTAAAEDLNKIRLRAGLEVTDAASAPELRQAIIKERRVELFTELGHRWFDLKRTGQAAAVLKDLKAGWDARDLLWPLPENEIRLNPNLAPQNTGY